MPLADRTSCTAASSLPCWGRKSVFSSRASPFQLARGGTFLPGSQAGSLWPPHHRRRHRLNRSASAYKQRALRMLERQPVPRPGARPHCPLWTSRTARLVRHKPLSTGRFCASSEDHTPLPRDGFALLQRPARCSRSNSLFCTVLRYKSLTCPYMNIHPGLLD